MLDAHWLVLLSLWFVNVRLGVVPTKQSSSCVQVR